MAVTQPLVPTDRGPRHEVTEPMLAAMTRRIVQECHPYRIILFGSRACGTARPDSDVDLLVIADQQGSNTGFLARVSAAAQLNGVPMDILVRTPAEIETRLAMGDFFIRRILEKGRTLYASPRTWERMEVHPAMTILEEWVEKSEADYRAAVDLNRRRRDPLPDGVGFHCQQCAEKYLKAFLIHEGEEPEKTHSMAKLLAECAAHDPEFAALMPHMEILDKFSVDPRYPGFFATIEQAQAALAAARSARRMVRRKLKL